ncbi:M23 family metallopeptidase [Leptolyngbya sp. AN02str]|uniref:M23 family metallopeptidase n=1 Tax=Leptolyngbya sp. AN02str TaxID=3423363 RepID=UPI003D322BFC
MKKRAIRLGRLLLAAGASLSCLVVIEAHQMMVNARSLNSQAAAIVQQRLTRPAQLPDMTPLVAPAIAPADATDQPNFAPKGSTPSSTKPAPTEEASSLAKNTGAPGDRAEDVSNLNVNQIAATQDQWVSASFPLEQFEAYTSPFGYRRSVDGYNFNEFHYGLDMAAPRGSYIRNWWTGTVVEVTDNSNCGTSVVVEAGGWLSIYCHMEGYVESSGGRRYMIDRAGGIQIFEGQEIAAGARVGRVGMTGRTTGPHLHWGLKYNNNWVDPAMVLRAMYDSQQRYSAQQSIN